MDLLNRYKGGLNPLTGPGQYPYTLYDYTPSEGFNVFAAVAFGMLILVHAFWFVSKSHTRVIQAMLALFCVWETVVYAIRCLNSFNPYREELFSAQYVMGLVGPTFLIIPMLLGLKDHLRSSTDATRALFNKPQLVVFLLVGYQAFVFLWTLISTPIWTCGNAALFIGQPISYQPNIARQIVLAGVANQVAITILIQGLLTWIMIKTFKRGGHQSAVEEYDSDRGLTASRDRRVSKLFILTLFVTFGSQFMRALYRLTEVADDMFGSPWVNEPMYGIFEFGPALFCALVWAVRPLGHYLPHEGAQRATAINNHKARISESA